jgi:hypothetical protein
MAAVPDQSYEHHAKYVPGFHYLTLGLALAFLTLSIVQLVRSPSLGTLTTLTGAAALAGLSWYARIFPVRVQDRVVCLEERLRLARLLPAELQGRIADFSRGQLIALRFASDAELPGLAARVLAENIRDREAVKRLITTWRPDRMRI